MAGKKVAVVTGANKGIGFGIMKEMCAKYDGVVYLTARDESRGLEAVKELSKLGFSARFHQLDIDDQNSINKFAEYIKNTYGGLDVLINNAGMAYKFNATESFGEQAENTIRVNFFGTRNLCRALFPLLRPGARVSNVSSASGHLSLIDGDEPGATCLKKKLSSPTFTEDELSALMEKFVKAAKAGNWKQEGWPNSTYRVSKAAMSSLTVIHQRAFDTDPRPDIVVNSCHPGIVKTDMAGSYGKVSIEQGAECPVYLALLPPNVKEPRGAYVWHDKQIVDWVNGPMPKNM